MCSSDLAAGVGTLGIVDYDVVDLSNLHRQILHGHANIGRPKVDSAAERLVVYRIKEPTSACRAMAEVIVLTTQAMDRTIRCLRTMDPGFHEHTVEVNRLENSADALLRDSLAAMFEEASDPIEVIKWKEIYETMEIVTDRCEDVANVIEGIILKMA